MCTHYYNSGHIKVKSATDSHNMLANITLINGTPSFMCRLGASWYQLELRFLAIVQLMSPASSMITCFMSAYSSPSFLVDLEMKMHVHVIIII